MKEELPVRCGQESTNRAGVGMFLNSRRSKIKARQSMASIFVCLEHRFHFLPFSGLSAEGRVPDFLVVRVLVARSVSPSKTNTRSLHAVAFPRPTRRTPIAGFALGIAVDIIADVKSHRSNVDAQCIVPQCQGHDPERHFASAGYFAAFGGDI